MLQFLILFAPWSADHGANKIQMNAWRGFPRVYFTRSWGNREGTALPYIEGIDDYGNSVLYVCVCVCVFFVLNSEQ